MNFFSKDGTNLLRLQKLDLSGDNILQSRPMLKKVFDTKETFFGFEKGLTGLSYRVILPLFDEKNDFVGAFEIGISVRKIMYSITFFNNIQGVFYETNLDKFITSDSSINPKFLEYLKKFECFCFTKQVLKPARRPAPDLLRRVESYQNKCNSLQAKGMQLPG